MELTDKEATAKEAVTYGYARRLMKNMGWGGQGLGVNENGITEPIRVRTRSKMTGLGFYEKHDQWMDRQEDFDEILQQLNEGHTSELTNDNGFSSLEKKSKSSRNRVHYHKFTRGKDLSRCTQQDILAILGKRKRDTGYSSKLDTTAELTNEQSSENATNSCEGEVGSTLEMPESKRHRSKKVSFRANISESLGDSYETEDVASSKVDLNCSAVSNREPTEETLPKKERKSKKKKRREKDVVLIEENCNADDEASAVASNNVLLGDHSSHCEHKKQKRKSSKNVETVVCVNDEETSASTQVEDFHTRKEKKHKKSSHSADFCVANGDESLNKNCSGNCKSAPKHIKRKKKKRSTSEDHDINQNGAVKLSPSDEDTDNLQNAATSECSELKKHSQRKEKIGFEKPTLMSDELEHIDHKNKDNAEDPDTCETIDENELQSKEETQSNSKYSKKKGSPKRPLQEASSVTDNLQLDNPSSSMKRNKSSLKALVRSMKSIKMFEGSNFLNIPGYPE